MKYLIAKSNRGYEAKFQIGGDGPMLAERLAQAWGISVLYKGEIDDPDKAQAVVDAVEEVVKEANKTGEFDSKLLEERLSK